MAAPDPDARAPAEAPVPRLPRGKMFRLSLQQVVRIVMTAAVLVMVIAIQRPCAENVSKFVTGIGSDSVGTGAGPGAGSARETGSGLDPNVQYEPLTPDMTPAEIQAAMDRARARAAAAGSGSATAP